MSRIYLFVLFFGIAVRFGDCENNNIYGNDIDCTQSAPGSDKTYLSPIEKVLKGLKLPIDALGSVLNRKNRKSNIEQGSFSYALEEASNFIIFPGTRWCGNGDDAKNENDLGRFNDTDACCRAHDNCNNDILAGATKVNLINNGIFTRSACPCDNAFYDCLKKASSLPAKTIGNTYFNVLGPQCFLCTCPEDNCNPNDGTDCNGQCKKYKWINNPKF
jgi:hypothetical protein